jgi:hypothetical protein
MFTRWLNFTERYPWRWLAEGVHKVRALRQRHKAFKATREARGITLLREWLSPEQKMQFDASRCFEVVGCHTGRRYRIRHGTATNVLEIDDAGRPVMGWCFVPSGDLVAGDVMLAQKIALETNESAALAAANRFTVQASNSNTLDAMPRRAY